MHFLGKNIRYLRKRSSQRQDDIALLVNKGQTTIGNWENGVSEPSIGDLLIISNYFGIPIDVLVKTDLTQTDASGIASENSQSLPGPGWSNYDLDAQKSSQVQESSEDKWHPILEEIKTIRSEIERIKSRLPDEE